MAEHEEAMTSGPDELPDVEEDELIELDPVLLAEIGLRLGASFVLMPDSVLPLDDDRARRSAFRALLAPLVR